MNSGIYKITCLYNNKIYIGSSKNIPKRWKRHISNLKNNTHVNIHLQRSFNKYGINFFSLDIIENCSIELLLEKEQYYLDNIKPYKHGFNISKGSNGGDNLTNHPNRVKIIEKIKYKTIERYKNMTQGVMNLILSISCNGSLYQC